jgi:hypothetical protein
MLKKVRIMDLKKYLKQKEAENTVYSSFISNNQIDGVKNEKN